MYLKEGLFIFLKENELKTCFNIFAPSVHVYLYNFISFNIVRV